MTDLDRRQTLLGAAALATGALLPGPVLSQGRHGATRLPRRGEYLIRGAAIVSVDTKIGDLARGDVHIRNGEIVAVAASLNAPRAEVINGSGMLCLPGFVETHWHLWTSLMRPFTRADNDQLEYFPVTARLGVHYTPEDSYRAVRLGLAEALYSGITTVHNFCHNTRSAQHAEAELRAMRDSGLRGRFSYGTPAAGAMDKPMDYGDIARVKSTWMPNDGLLTLGVSSRNVVPGQSVRGAMTVEMARKDWGAAREMGLPIVLHASPKDLVKMLDEARLLGPDVMLVHPMMTSAEERAILAERRTSFSMSPLGEARRPPGAGVIQLGELLEAGVQCSISIDQTATANCDFFSCMRMLYTLHQHRIGPRFKLTTKRMVELGTMDGARALGVADRVGSLTPGKRADVILVRTTDPNMAPYGDPYEALVMHANPSNVDTVIVDGRILRRTGRFSAVEYARVARDAMQSAQALKTKAGWP